MTVEYESYLIYWYIGKHIIPYLVYSYIFIIA